MCMCFGDLQLCTRVLSLTNPVKQAGSLNVYYSMVKFRYSGSKLSLMQRVAMCYIVLLS